MRCFENRGFDAAAGAGAGAAGPPPEWNLADLYEGMDAPELKTDLEQAASDAAQFARDYRGKLAELASGRAGERETRRGGGALRGAARFARPHHVLRQPAPCGRRRPIRAIAKFFGDIQEKITDASTRLLFFQLELNRIDDAALAAAAATPPLSRWKPWLEDIAKEKPFELDDKLEELFHEKSISGAAAWNRLFDETIASLRFKVGADELAIEPVLNLMQDAREEVRREAARAIGKTLNDNLRIFALIANTLAKDKEISDRWRGFKDVADARHLSNRVEGEVVAALVAAVEAAHPRLSHRYYKLKAKWFGRDALDYWDRNAPLPAAPARQFSWDEAREVVLSAYAGFAPRMAEIAGDFFDQALDRRAGAPRQGAGRLLASDRPIRASLCAAELPGQAARRDDARP